MEDQVYRKLTSEQKELLATLYETQSMKAILNAGVIYQQIKAEHVAMVAPNMDNVLTNRGNIFGARFIYDLCKYAHSKQKKA